MVHERAGAGALRIVRAVVFALWAGIVADTQLGLWASLPRWMFDPPGILRLIPEALWTAWLDPVILEVFRWILVVLLVWAAAAPRPSRAGLIPVALALVLFHGFVLGWGGYLNHSRIGPMYVAVFLAFVPHQAAADEPRVAGASLFLAALLISVAYLLIGVHRFLVGGIQIFLNDALPAYMLLRTFEPGSYSFEVSYWLLQHGWVIPILKLGFFVTTVAEVLSPLVLFHRRLRLAWLAVIVPFHVVTLFTMNIFFWENLVLIALLFSELPSRLERWWNVRGSGIVRFHADRTTLSRSSAPPVV